LAFLNEETNKWECEDPCLESKGDLLCGSTSHFTSFALLLAGTEECGSENSEQNEVLYILSASFIGVAIIIAGVCAVIADLKVRKKQYGISKTLKRVSHASNKISRQESESSLVRK
jgi:hypothetical protein